MMRHWFHRQAKLGIGLLACLMLAGGYCFSLEAELDTSTPFSQDVSIQSQSQKLPPLQGTAQKKHLQTQTSKSGSTTPVLTGKVETLQQAMDNERNIVDWYAWYLSARAYLAATGGIQCPLGTPIKFYKNGKIEPLSYDFKCISSLLGKYFPLPAATRLDALILPVRPGNGPPASPEELHSRVQEWDN